MDDTGSGNTGSGDWEILELKLGYAGTEGGGTGRHRGGGGIGSAGTGRYWEILGVGSLQLEAAHEGRWQCPLVKLRQWWRCRMVTSRLCRMLNPADSGPHGVPVVSDPMDAHLRAPTPSMRSSDPIRGLRVPGGGPGGAPHRGPLCGCAGCHHGPFVPSRCCSPGDGGDGAGRGWGGGVGVPREGWGGVGGRGGRFHTALPEGRKQDVVRPAWPGWWPGGDIGVTHHGGH